PIENLSVTYERSDASFRWIMLVLVSAAVLAVVAQVAILWFFYDLRAYQTRIKQSPFRLAPAPSTALPREPRLEGLDRATRAETGDVGARQPGKEDILKSLGPTPEGGFVHIPIERAMELLADKLPARQADEKRATLSERQRRDGGLVGGGDSNSGR